MTKYLEQKQPDLDEELNILFSVYDRMIDNGLIEKTETNIDFNFTSDEKKHLENLLKIIEKEFKVKIYYLKKLKFFGGEYELSVEIQDIIIYKDLLFFLISYLFDLSIKNNCYFGDWGASINNKEVKYSEFKTNDVIDDAYNLYQAGNKYKSYEKFFIASESQSCAEALYNMANLKYEMGFVNSAITLFTRAIELDPKYPLPYLNRGVAYYDVENYENAIDDYLKVIELTPKKPGPYINLGNAYIQLKNKELAIDYFEKAIQLGSDDARIAKEKGLKLIEEA